MRTLREAAIEKIFHGVTTTGLRYPLEDETLPDLVAEALEQHGVEAAALTLEITETGLINPGDRAKGILRELSRSGLAISIDDFGAGFTSFRYLRELDVVSEIKIDRLYVTTVARDTRDATIVRSIAALGEGLGATVSAEGIEEIDTVPLLTELGCHRGQGYAIATPMAADAFTDWMARAEA